MKKLTGIKLAVVSLVVLGLLALFFLSLPASSKPEAMPGAELDHNVRLVYWQRERLSRAQKRADVEPTYTPYVWRLNVPEEFVRIQTDGTSPNDPLLDYDETRKEKPFVALTGHIDHEAQAMLLTDTEYPVWHVGRISTEEAARRKYISQFEVQQ